MIEHNLKTLKSNVVKESGLSGIDLKETMEDATFYMFLGREFLRFMEGKVDCNVKTGGLNPVDLFEQKLALIHFLTVDRNIEVIKGDREKLQDLLKFVSRLLEFLKDLELWNEPAVHLRNIYTDSSLCNQMTDGDYTTTDMEDCDCIECIAIARTPK